jgi:starvation-inducible DNA-binding protein
MNNHVVSALSEILADTYALYLKTQNYHWNVTGPTFTMLHALFETQYNELALAVDVIAERIRALGHKAPASFSAFQRLTHIKDGHAEAKAHDMLQDLLTDHQTVMENLRKARIIADEVSDVGTVSLLEDRLGEHEKTAWMLNASM